MLWSEQKLRYVKEDEFKTRVWNAGLVKTPLLFQNEDLQRQLGILSEELVKSKQGVLLYMYMHYIVHHTGSAIDFLKESAKVSQVQVSLDRAQDEIQLMKLSVSEKETQLLQSQDQYL